MCDMEGDIRVVTLGLLMLIQFLLPLVLMRKLLKS